ncbi:MAG: aerobic carbon-monoxide dehydrogenase small subunit [Nocardioidaceae bacterium]|jgi:carbon-monoxide dehydrogenase small subunit|nr:aerobic carbon-monoxide dehydrogenase small subunit [Nocardioidaceae bacterium]
MTETGVLRLRVNGEVREVRDVATRDSLLNVLRERLELPGTKSACEQGECGSCSVWVDERLVCSCLVLALSAQDSNVVTVEGLSSDACMSDVQRALLAEGGVQCGFCTPGIVVAIHDLLQRQAAPSDLDLREAISGNLCRCTGYGRILAAAHAVVGARTGNGVAAPESTS